ncbi:peptidase G2 autoproteolytic cleavage domain-containing protein [Halalkalibacter sp. AB-rgal2]|uniref:peptidase G2 autoproteolytic cleavage domain-containing protein n=1 Tax=Halalkalibacter sp. AB-rgal2 TaxID=3242695 RepID=UPI00359E6932
MSFEQHDWLDHVVEYPDQYKVEQLEDGRYRITPTWEENPDEIIVDGTRFSANMMNRIEQGIADAHEITKEHIDDDNNPHGVTKAQVGLGNVDNVKQASKTEFDNHITDNDDPHLAKQQAIGWAKSFGLGDTFNIISDTDLNDLRDNGLYAGQNLMNAPQGSSDWFYVVIISISHSAQIQVAIRHVTSPTIFTRRKSQGSWQNWTEMETTAGAQEKVDAHAIRTDNPHSVTKQQVGLGNVPNNSMATQGEAEVGTTNTKFMSPLRVKQAFDKFIEAVNNSISNLSNTFNSHINNTGNPHGVTKTQVSLGNVDNVKQASKTEFDNHVDDISMHKRASPNIIQSGVYSNAEGLDTEAIGDFSHAEGDSSKASGSASHAEGINTEASGYVSHAEGFGTSAIMDYSHAEGYNTESSGNGAHAEGRNTKASGIAAHAEGSESEASGSRAHAEGINTTASGAFSHAEGLQTVANVYASHAQGRYSKQMIGSGSSINNNDDAFVIGNGTSTSNKSNAFRVTFNGSVYGLSAFNSTGADYAEYFEWLDGNTNDEDRVGYFVTLDGDKIRKANNEDSYVLGIISAQPAIIGDSHQDDWYSKHVTDDWGRIQYQWQDYEEEETKLIHHEAKYDEEGNLIQEEYEEEVVETVIKRGYLPILNPNWNPEEEYIPREQRKEWSPVGMVGKLLVRDDGTCQVNGYCKSSDEGIATASDQGYRVMERVSENIIRVLFR